MKWIKSIYEFKVDDIDIYDQNYRIEYQRVKDWCDENLDRRYKINKDNTVDYIGTVYLNGGTTSTKYIGYPVATSELAKNPIIRNIPVQFNKVIGDFNCSFNTLTNLIGSPIELTGNLYCDNNNITSFEGCHKLPYLYHNNPIYHLFNILKSDLSIQLNELNERVDEFELIKDNNVLDLLKIEQLYDFYNKEFDYRRFDIKGYKTI